MPCYPNLEQVNAAVNAMVNRLVNNYFNVIQPCRVGVGVAVGQFLVGAVLTVVRDDGTAERPVAETHRLGLWHRGRGLGLGRRLGGVGRRLTCCRFGAGGRVGGQRVRRRALPVAARLAGGQQQTGRKQQGGCQKEGQQSFHKSVLSPARRGTVCGERQPRSGSASRLTAGAA